MKFHTQLKPKDIFKFSLAYTFSGIQALLTILVLVVAGYMIVNGATKPNMEASMFSGVLIIILFFIVNPAMLYVKAKKQAIENPAYKEPTYYTLKEDGIFVEFKKDSALIEWNRIIRLTHLMGLNILYTGRKQAFIFPDYELGDRKDEMIAFMKERIKSAKN